MATFSAPFRCALLLVAVALACSWSASAQDSISASAPADAGGVPGGDAGVLISVVDERGGPLPDAEVSLRLGDSAERLVLRTDEEGQAEVRGIAAGEWQVDIRREGFMLFNAYVLLDATKKPKIAFSSRQRTGSYWEPLQAVFLKPGIDLTRGVASGRESVRRAQQRANKATKEAEREQRRAERASNRGRLARVVPSEPIEPVIQDLVEPKAADLNSGEAEESTAESLTTGDAASLPVESGVPSQARTEPVSATDAGADGSSSPIPATPTSPVERQAAASTAQPEVEAVPAVGNRDWDRAPDSTPRTVASRPGYEPLDPPPAILRNPNLLPAGACPECGPGEFSVTATGQAEKFTRGANCTLDRSAQLVDLAPSINAALADGLSAFAGSLAESNGNDVGRLLPEALREDLRPALEASPSSCQVLGVVLPRGARYIGFRYQAGERSVMAECLDVDTDGAQSCQVGDARWLAPPQVVKTGGVTLVLGVFENRSKRNTRLPRLVAYFAPERGWLPPSR